MIPWLGMCVRRFGLYCLFKKKSKTFVFVLSFSNLHPDNEYCISTKEK